MDLCAEVSCDYAGFDLKGAYQGSNFRPQVCHHQDGVLVLSATEGCPRGSVRGSGDVDPMRNVTSADSQVCPAQCKLGAHLDLERAIGDHAGIRQASCILSYRPTPRFTTSRAWRLVAGAHLFVWVGECCDGRGLPKHRPSWRYRQKWPEVSWSTAFLARARAW